MRWNFQFLNLVFNKSSAKLNGLFKKIKTDRITTWLDKISYIHILLIWIIIVTSFGFMYFIFSSDNHHLLNTAKKTIVDNVIDTIYFSFVTATTTGFGDIAPTGFFKFIAITEVIFGLMLLAVVTSKLVSIKQDIILNELYDLSLHEKVNRMRSSLVLFRQNLIRVISKIDDGTIKRREINEIYVYISSFEDILDEMLLLIKEPNNNFTKGIDRVNTELIFNGILSSFEKLNELIFELNQNKKDWKRDMTLELINGCINSNEVVFNKLNSSKILPEKIIIDLNIRKNKIIPNIKEGLKKDVIDQQMLDKFSK